VERTASQTKVDRTDTFAIRLHFFHWTVHGTQADRAADGSMDLSSRIVRGGYCGVAECDHPPDGGEWDEKRT
jgi:hypothetical protein